MPNHVLLTRFVSPYGQLLIRQTAHKALLLRYAIMTVFVGLFVVLGSQTSSAADRPDSFADLAERLSPAVVNISTTTVVRDHDRGQWPQFPEGLPDFFREFGDRDDGPRQAQSLGSGFIIDSSGIVVTNNHVIENADEVWVILANDKRFEAEVIGSDAKTDIAVLKIDSGKTRLEVVSFGDSDDLRVGDWVMAIGNPFGLGGTVTAGIVSARGRDIRTGPYDDFIQTDASINRGNSGGPLFNLEGEVIGITTLIFSQSGGSVGIGFAIPSNLAEQVVGQLQNYGRTRRGWLGVFIQEVTEGIADSLALDQVGGALVSSVTESGPAQEAGLEPGDVILSFDGKEVNDSRDLPRIVAETPVDATVKIEIMRNGKAKTLSVTLGELEQAENKGLLSSNDQTGTAGTTTLDEVGLTVAPLNPEFAEKYGIESDDTAIVVVAVADGGPAAGQDIQPGDIIRRLNQSGVSSVEQLVNGIAEAKENGRQGVLMLIEEQGRTRFVQISFEQ